MVPGTLICMLDGCWIFFFPTGCPKNVKKIHFCWLFGQNRENRHFPCHFQGGIKIVVEIIIGPFLKLLPIAFSGYITKNSQFSIYFVILVQTLDIFRFSNFWKNLKTTNFVWILIQKKNFFRLYWKHLSPIIFISL